MRNVSSISIVHEAVSRLEHPWSHSPHTGFTLRVVHGRMSPTSAVWLHVCKGLLPKLQVPLLPLSHALPRWHLESWSSGNRNLPWHSLVRASVCLPCSPERILFWHSVRAAGSLGFSLGAVAKVSWTDPVEVVRGRKMTWDNCCQGEWNVSLAR